MRTIDVDEETFEGVSLLADFAGVTRGEVVRRWLDAARERSVATATAKPEPRDGVPVHGTYMGERVAAMFDSVTHAVTIIDGPVPKGRFKSPTGAARAVISSLNRGRKSPHRNGWTFWRLDDGGGPLQDIRFG